MEKHNFLNLLFLLLFAVTLSACNQNERDLRKFISRMNAEEYNSASSYIYPEDLTQLYFFIHEVKPLCPMAFIELKEMELQNKNDKNNRQIKILLQWKNPNDALKNYFRNIGRPLAQDGCFSDIISVKETVGGDKLTFNWGIPNVENQKLRIVGIKKEQEEINNIGIFADPSTKATKVASLEKGEKCVFEQNEAMSNWLYCYYVDPQGEIATGYINNKQVDTLSNTFFHLNIFESMGLLLAVVIAVIILFPIWWARAFFIKAKTAVWGLILVLGCLYVLYMCIEKILFELFIINLPY